MKGRPFIFVIAYYLFLTSLSHIPSADLPQGPEFFEHFDKFVHFGLYAVWGALLVRLSRDLKSLLVAVAVLFFGAALDEVHQIFVAGREADVWDFLADVLGGLCGGLVFWRFFCRPCGHEPDK